MEYVCFVVNMPVPLHVFCAQDFYFFNAYTHTYILHTKRVFSAGNMSERKRLVVQPSCTILSTCTAAYGVIQSTNMCHLFWRLFLTTRERERCFFFIVARLYTVVCEWMFYKKNNADIIDIVITNMQNRKRKRVRETINFVCLH